MTSDSAPQDDGRPVRPTNYARIAGDLPIVDLDPNASSAAIARGEAPPGIDRILSDLRERLAGSDASPAVLAATEDFIRSLAPAFLPAPARSVYELEENRLFASPVEAGPVVAQPLSSANVDITAWQYNATHVLPLGNIHATQRDVTFEGVTVELKDGGSDGVAVTRYIDWLFVMAQLGIVGTQRPMLGQLDGKGIVGPTPRNPPDPPDPGQPRPRPWWRRLTHAVGGGLVSTGSWLRRR